MSVRSSLRHRVVRGIAVAGIAAAALGATVDGGTLQPITGTKAFAIYVNEG